MTRRHRLRRRPGAAERHVHQIEPGRECEQRTGEMRRRAGARRGETVLAGIGFHQINKFSDALRRELRIDDQHIGRIRDQTDGDEVALGIVGDLGVEARIDHEARGHDEQRIAIGRGMRRVAHADVAAGTGLILDVELFAELIAEFARQNAGDCVGWSPGRKRHDQPNGMVWIVRRLQRRRHDHHRADEQRDEAQGAPHAFLMSARLQRSRGSASRAAFLPRRRMRRGCRNFRPGGARQSTYGHGWRWPSLPR